MYLIPQVADDKVIERPEEQPKNKGEKKQNSAAAECVQIDR